VIEVSVGRLPPVTPQLPATRPQPAPDVRAAQRAFFAAATEAQTQAEPTRPAPAQRADQPEPERYLRPGSIIDIKV
jgi:hypothetical protein